jgi:hypothetical protein
MRRFAPDPEVTCRACAQNGSEPMRSVAQSATASKSGARIDGDAMARIRAALPTIVFLIACILAVLFAGSGFGDEGRTGAGTDAPRYLMNGVYFMDVLRDRPFASPNEFVEYTRYYYARYPALSLGHHPVLLSAATVPVFAVAGISLSAGRVVVIAFFLAAVAFTWALLRRTHGEWPAAAGALLVATNPYLLGLGQSVLAEIPGTTLLLASSFFIHRFCETQRRWDLAGAVLACSLALYTRHLAAFALPGFAVYAVARLGWRRLLARDIIIAAIAFAILVAPLVPLTLTLAQANVGYVRGQVTGRHTADATEWLSSRTTAVRYAFAHQFSGLVLVAIGLGALSGAVRRDRGSLLFVLWFASVLLCVLLLTGTLEPVRYSMYWIPPLLAIAASLAATPIRRGAGTVLTTILAIAVAHQAWLGAHTPATTTSGYEAVAKFVVQQSRAATVLFSAEIDSGLFVFFVRKHDPNRNQVILRADKVLTTSFMRHSSIEERIASPSEIYDVLHRYGTRYIVVEDRPTTVRVLKWVQDVVQTPDFREIYRVPLISNDPRLPGASLAVYEYQHATPPDPNAVLDIRLPIVGQRLAVPLSELLERRFLR